MISLYFYLYFNEAKKSHITFTVFVSHNITVKLIPRIALRELEVMQTYPLRAHDLARGENEKNKPRGNISDP